MVKNKTFPVFAVLLLILAIVWAMEELRILIIDIPWFPVILGVIAIGMIVNRYSK